MQPPAASLLHAFLKWCLMLVEWLVLLAFPAAMAFCGSHDFVKMTIPNIVTGGLVLLFVAVALLAGLSLEQIGWHLLAGLATLVATFALFVSGKIGGGDAKMIAAVGLWFGFEQILTYIVIAAGLGGVLALLILQARAYPWPMLVLRYPFIARLTDKGEGIPYGVSLGAAALFLYPQTAIWQSAFSA
jgi:prepilin peptidase CpaA